MKRLACLCVLFAGALCYGAESGEGIRIGVVDMDAVFSAYDREQGVSLRVREIAREGEAERRRLREEISIIESKLRDAEAGGPEAERFMGELQEKISEYRDFDRAQKEKESGPVHEALNLIYEKVREYAEKAGLDLVLEKRLGLFGRTVLFSIDRIEITEDIIENL